jgi:ribosomal protein L12E/L44/L45/RPP1/RPP2
VTHPVTKDELKIKALVKPLITDDIEELIE